MRIKFGFTALSLAVAALSTPASAVIYVFSSPLTPEVSGATGSGLVTVTLDTDLDRLGITASWLGLTGVTTVAHIHCCVAPPGTVGVAVTPGTLPGFPTGLSAGSYSITLDTSNTATYTAGFLAGAGGTAAGAEARLLAGLQNGQAYFNIHSNRFPNGEIRGFLAAVPEPGTWATMIIGFGLLGGIMRGRRRGTETFRTSRRQTG